MFACRTGENTASGYNVRVRIPGGGLGYSGETGMVVGLGGCVDSPAVIGIPTFHWINMRSRDAPRMQRSLSKEALNALNVLGSAVDLESARDEYDPDRDDNKQQARRKTLDLLNAPEVARWFVEEAAIMFCWVRDCVLFSFAH